MAPATVGGSVALPLGAGEPQKKQLSATSVHGSLAEWSKALAPGASPQGRGFEPLGCQRCASRAEFPKRPAEWSEALAPGTGAGWPRFLQPAATDAPFSPL